MLFRSQSHAAMDPITATASVTDNNCEFWGQLQIVDLPKMIAKKITGLPPEKIQINTTYLGGGFGRKTESDFIVSPIVASKVLGKPVQINWSREADIRGRFYRPPSLVQLKAGLSSKGITPYLRC